MTINHCRAEQLRCSEYIEKNGWDDGAALGMSDWLHEEFIWRRRDKRPKSLSLAVLPSTHGERDLRSTKGKST